MNIKLFSKFLTLLLIFFITSCGGGSSNRDQVIPKWTEDLLESMRRVNIGPPPNARAIAITYSSAFDAWAMLDSIATPVYSDQKSTITNFLDDDLKVAVSYAIYRTLVDLFPTEKPLFDQRMKEFGLDIHNQSLDLNTFVGVGNYAAKKVLEERHQDGANQLGNLNEVSYSDYTGYQPVNTADQVFDLSRWQPLRVTRADGSQFVQKFLTPHRGFVRPFSLDSGFDILPREPNAVDSPKFLAEVQEVIDYTANLNDRTKVIAEYWADGPKTETPPGHWVLFADWVAKRDNLSLVDNIKLFFMVGNAVMDAGIACWATKVNYDYVRPVTAIREIFQGQKITGYAGPDKGIAEVKGEEWLPYQAIDFITPPFAEYTSGHSTFSAAASEVLKLFTGSDYFGFSTTIKKNSFKIENNVPTKDITLTYQTFSEAAQEAGLSRLYGGIHFQSANIIGQEMGREIGNRVFDKVNKHINGE